MTEGTTDNRIDYSSFCKAFYSGNSKAPRLKGCGTQKAIAEFFFRAALGDDAVAQLAYTEDTFKKWFSGKRVPADAIWSQTLDVFDANDFQKILADTIDQRAAGDIATAFGIDALTDGTDDYDRLCHALTMQFQALAEGNGSAENIMATSISVRGTNTRYLHYLEDACRKFSSQKTLFYASSECSFYDFFVCNHIDPEGDEDFYEDYYETNDRVIRDATLKKLREYSNCVLLIGTGGIGKTMMMRHLFLQSAAEYERTGSLPILIILREFSRAADLSEMLIQSMQRFDPDITMSDIESMMTAGKCQILLDGIDEIKAEDADRFLYEIDRMVDQYPECQYVASSRGVSSFVELQHFVAMGICPFDEEQAFALVDKLEKDLKRPASEPGFRKKLREMLDQESHLDFIKIPLLLTMMLMTYYRCGNIPTEKPAFYEEAYQTLLHRHDDSKLAFEREFRSVSTHEEFTMVFRELCARTYIETDFELDWYTFKRYFEKLKSVEEIRQHSREMTLENFIHDVCNVVCTMYKDAERYQFLHRTFQEYFFADYFSRQDDETLIWLEWQTEAQSQYLYDENCIAYEMLYDMIPMRVERCIFLPYLCQTFWRRGKKKKYFSFLDKFYFSCEYTCVDEQLIQKYEIDDPYISSDEVMINGDVAEWILRTIKCKPLEKVPGLEVMCEYEDLKDRTIYGRDYPGEKFHHTVLDVLDATGFDDELKKVRERITNNESSGAFVCDEAGKPVAFGYTYDYKFFTELRSPSGHEDLINVLMSKACPLQNQYQAVRKYFLELKTRHKALPLMIKWFLVGLKSVRASRRGEEWSPLS